MQSLFLNHDTSAGKCDSLSVEAKRAFTHFRSKLQRVNFLRLAIFILTVYLAYKGRTV